MGAARTPIEAWPPIKYRGKPGYSAKYYAAMAGAPEDPLRVADRIAARRVGETVSEEAKARIAAGEDFSAVLEWQSRELTSRREAEWRRLCGSFDAVIAELESSPLAKTSAGIKRIISQAKRAARQEA
jgi:hypothetical protein